MIWAHGFSLWSAGSTAEPVTRYKHPGRKVWWAEESCPPHSSQEAKTLRPFQGTRTRAHTHKHPGDPLSPTGPILQFLPPPSTPIMNSLVDLSIDQVRTLASDTALSPTLIIVPRTTPSAQLGLGWGVGNNGHFTSKPEQKGMHLLRLE